MGKIIRSIMMVIIAIIAVIGVTLKWYNGKIGDIITLTVILMSLVLVIIATNYLNLHNV